MKCMALCHPYSLQVTRHLGLSYTWSVNEVHGMEYDPAGLAVAMASPHEATVESPNSPIAR